jgi:heme exporter protein C
MSSEYELLRRAADTPELRKPIVSRAYWRRSGLNLLVAALLALSWVAIRLHEPELGGDPASAWGRTNVALAYLLPLAVVALGFFLVNFVASIIYLKNRALRADAVAAAAAEVGLLFCGTAVFGTTIKIRAEFGFWWIADANLMTAVILCLAYLAYLMLRPSANIGQGPVLSAVLAVFAFVDVPITYFSLHWIIKQHVVKNLATPPHLSLAPMLWNGTGFIALGLMLLWARYRMGMFRARCEESLAEGSPRPD